MPLPSSEHRTVKAEVKQTRNTAARARRGTLPGRPKNVEAVVLLAGTATDGQLRIAAFAEKDNGRGYELRFDGETWTCCCFVAKWRGACSHTDAAREAWKLGRLPAVQEALERAIHGT